jgi:mRNA-degrading endonuclease RelE of RelBE toxin-antitoxin system
MAYKIIVDPTAGIDINENIDWYNKVQPGLGLKFYKQIQAIFKTIRKNPHAFYIRYKTSHTATIKKFPFMVHYFIDDEIKTIVVTSVLHTSRDPIIWDERSEE